MADDKIDSSLSSEKDSSIQENKIKVGYADAFIEIPEKSAEKWASQGVTKIKNILRHCAPYFVVKKGRDNLLNHEQVLKEINAIKSGHVDFNGKHLIPAGNDEISTLVNQAAANSFYQGVQKEITFSQIIADAVEKISQEKDEDISHEPINVDWFNSFRSYAENSSGDLKEIWANILAGEAKEPGTYSLRTFSFISHLTKTEAKLVERLLPLISAKVVYQLSKDTSLGGLTTYFDYEELFELESMGLINGVAGSLGNKLNLEPKSPTLINFTEFGLLLYTKKKQTLQLGIFRVTTIGENLKLALSENIKDSEEYILDLRNHIEDMASDVSVTFCQKQTKWKSRTNEAEALLTCFESDEEFSEAINSERND